MSAQVVLARPLRTGLLGPQEVHAYRVPTDGSPWRAVCGARITPDRAEIVPHYTGLPGGQCSLGAALAADVPPVSRTELHGRPPAPSTATAGFSLSWRARLVHLVPAGAPTTELDGGTLALGRCGGLGWGPIPTKPALWPTCPACAEQAPETHPDA